MRPATHGGTCQICGRVQKLPGDSLSRHGYTKQWGFFNGTCPGSGWRPYELAYDRIEHAIANSRAAIARLEAEAAELATAPVSDEAPFFMEYSSVRRGRMESTVKVLPATEGRPECNGVVFVFADGRKTPGARYACYSTVADTVEKLRRERAVRIGRHVQEHQQYIAWQESRIRDWKLAELQPVTKGAQ